MIVRRPFEAHIEVRREDAETLEAAGDALMRSHHKELAVKLYALALRVRQELAA